MTDNAREDRVAPRTDWPHEAEDENGDILVDPRTEAGKRLVDEDPNWYNNRETLTQAILAIEAEAASLDSDELRKAVEALHRWDVTKGWTAFNDIVAQLDRALLSAGDKAEAPLDE